MIKRLTFGQYKDRNSLIHRLDARLKIIYIILFSILSFTIRNKNDILAFSFFVFLLILLARVSPKEFLNNLRPFYFIFVFLALMYLLFARSQFTLGMIFLWRFLMLISMSFLLIYTTSVSDLIAAIEKLSQPLKIFKINPRNLAVMISAAIRFVPVLFMHLEKTKEAMTARLANPRKTKHIKLLVSVILQKMLRSAATLSDAMHSRLYNENAKSRIIMKFKKYDIVSIIAVAFIVLVIY